MSTVWVVVIELDECGGTPVGIGTVRHLMERMASAHPTTLYSPDRYAIQVLVPGPEPADALDYALRLWRDAATDLDCADWQLVRAEVIEPSELERERSARQVRERGNGAEEPSSVEDLVLRQAFHDSLTGIANRELFRHHLDNVLLRAEATGARHTLLVCDLDGFGATNQSLGDDIGDEVLVAVADRLAAMIRRQDSIARVGPDEFAVLLYEGGGCTAVDVADRMLMGLESPLRIGAQAMTVTASVGIAVSDFGQNAETLLHKAEAALAVAKTQGAGGRYVFSDDFDATKRAQAVEPAPQRPEKVAMLRLMQRAAKAAAECRTLEEAAAIVLRQVCAHTGWQAGHLYVSGEHGRELIPWDVWHLAGAARLASFKAVSDVTRVPLGSGLPGLALATGMSVWTENLASEQEHARVALAVEAGMSAALAFPIRVQHEVVGVMEFFSDRAVALDESYVEVVAAVVDQLARVVERTRAETALRQSEGRLAALLESTPGAAIAGPDAVRRPQRRPVFTNPPSTTIRKLRLAEGPP